MNMSFLSNCPRHEDLISAKWLDIFVTRLRIPACLNMQVSCMSEDSEHAGIVPAGAGSIP
jgi:hypothetical protein